MLQQQVQFLTTILIIVDALAVIAEGRVIQRGDDVGFIPFNELLT